MLRCAASRNLHVNRVMNTLVILAVLVVVMLIIAAFMGVFSPKPAAPPLPGLLIQDGVQYPIISLGSSFVRLNHSEKSELVRAYVITFAYNQDGKQFRGTIQVPKYLLPEVDKSLPMNTVVWDKTIDVEGKEYRTVRWNHPPLERAVVKPVLEQEKTLEKRSSRPKP